MNIEKYVHQIWLSVICILLLVGLFLPVGQFSNEEGATALLTNFRINYIEGTHGAGMWALAVLQIAALAVALFELLLSGFRNFVLQKRLIVNFDISTLPTDIFLLQRKRPNKNELDISTKINGQK